MPKFIDHTGKKVGRLTVIERVANSDDGHALWRCICRCGNETIVRGGSLRQGNTTSCGCKLAEWQKEFTRSCYPLGKVEPMPALEDLDDLVKW